VSGEVNGFERKQTYAVGTTAHSLFMSLEGAESQGNAHGGHNGYKSNPPEVDSIEFQL